MHFFLIKNSNFIAVEICLKYNCQKNGEKYNCDNTLMHLAVNAMKHYYFNLLNAYESNNSVEVDCLLLNLKST